MREFLADVFTRTPIKPTDRTKIGTHEVYIADGFVPYEDLPIIQKHFCSAIKSGKEGRDEWPNGCFATLWLTPGKIAARGGIRLSNETDQSVRLNSIRQDANEELNKKIH